MKTWQIFICGVMLCAAAPADPYSQAISYYHQGRLAESQAILIPLGRAGNIRAQYDLGWLWEHGQIAGDRATAQATSGRRTLSNNEEAIDWYLKASLGGQTDAMAQLGRLMIAEGYAVAGIKWLNYSARWGNGLAKNYLTQLGLSVPQPDLLVAQQQQNNNQNQAALALGLGLACAVVGGCTSAPMPSNPSTGILQAPSKKNPQCTLNPVFKDIYGNPKVDCH